MIGEKRLMVVADGALNYIPFEVLLKTADSGDFSSLGYLVKIKRSYLRAISVGRWRDQTTADEERQPRDADHR